MKKEPVNMQIGNMYEKGKLLTLTLISVYLKNWNKWMYFIKKKKKSIFTGSWKCEKYVKYILNINDTMHCTYNMLLEDNDNNKG